MKSMLPMFDKVPMSVSPTKTRLCTKVVTDFILDSHSNFQLFFGSLDFFVTFSIKACPAISAGEKSKLSLSKEVLISIPHRKPSYL